MTFDAIGLLAGLFVILAFYARQALWLRSFAILSNVFFVVYAIGAELMPVLLLHAILLPLNLARLFQISRGRHPDRPFSRQVQPHD